VILKIDARNNQLLHSYIFEAFLNHRIVEKNVDKKISW